MKLPAYTVCKNLRTGEYEISKRGKPVSSHKTREDAQDECQRLCEDDQWHRSNRE